MTRSDASTTAAGFAQWVVVVVTAIAPVLEAAAVTANGGEAALAKLREVLPRLKPPRLVAQVPRELAQSLEGVPRVSSFVDLRSASESTITIARNEWKHIADVHVDIPDDMPPIVCLRVASKGRGLIRVVARVDGRLCEIGVSDTGTDIAEASRSRVFDPFFTTKPVGRGTGRGLAIAYNVIFEKHGGTISFESEVGPGTTFIIRIPRDSEGVRGAA